MKSGGSSVGPKLTDTTGKKHRIYVIALIDDATVSLRVSLLQ